MTEVICPGDRIGSTVIAAADAIAAVSTPAEACMSQKECVGGSGTYTQQGSVFASLTGAQVVVGSAPGTEAKPVISVTKAGTLPLVPKKQDVVTVKVTKITPRLVSTDILCVGNLPLSDEKFTGIIRLEDVRAAEIDKVQIASCFRPGDVVKAEVVSLGTSRDYYLSTAQNHLGVVYAKSLAGVPMVPISWQEMQCPQTKAVEKRKVAKA